MSETAAVYAHIREFSGGRARDYRELLDKLIHAGFCIQLDSKVAKIMPRGVITNAKLVLFETGRISDDQLAVEYCQRRLTAIDPYLLASFNAQNPEFCLTRPNCTHWRDQCGRWCGMSFRNMNDVPTAFIVRGNPYWEANWNHVGIRIG